MELEAPLVEIKKNEKLLLDYTHSEEMVILYSCLIAMVRFFEGISWGYSPMLLHQTLDKESVIALKVTVNHLIAIKQTFRENLHLSEILN
jgi:hypothetical protein